MRLSNRLRRFARLRDCLPGGESPRGRDRPVRLGVEGLGDRTAPSAVSGTPPSVVTVERVGDAVEGGADGVFRFTRTGDATDPLTVDVSYGGTATRADDYRPDSPLDCVTFPVGASSVEVAVRALADGVYDPGEAAVVTVLPPGFMATGPYDVGAGYEAALAIADAGPADPLDPAAGGALPPAVEPMWPTGDAGSAVTPGGTSADGPPAATDPTDVRSEPGGAGSWMPAEFAEVPATNPTESDTLAGLSEIAVRDAGRLS